MALPPVFAASALYDSLLQAALRQFFSRATFGTEPIPSLSSDGRLAIEPTNDPSALSIRWFGSRHVLHVPARRPFTVVLIDEVESFAVRRTSASFETNPVDVHRATDAVMLGIDEIARKLPSVLFVTTTNFIDAIDDAFMSRADLVMHFALPDAGTIANILQHSLAELAVQWPELRPLSEARGEIAEVAGLCAGWNGRQVRKLVLAALAQRLEVSKNPALLSFEDLREAARKRGGVEWAGGAAPTSKELFPDVPKELMHHHDH